ncbi:MAG TPA: MotA/TolQ/ExbB proton channel family protein [Rhodocyclaceae bacterium]|jgi:biopolymer transport protein ExbB|nr:MotA/TolQ/ExbB proton channel family protein [Rhodocyclaceae bacterium]
MSNGFDFSSFWAQGDFVAHAVALLLAILSIASWTVILGKGWQIYRLRRTSPQALEAFWDAKSINEAINKVAGAEPFFLLAERGAEAVAHYGSHAQDEGHLDAHLSVSELVTRALRQGITRASSHLENGLTFLASVGSTAPFIGLFGTVWGIYHALARIGATGQASLDKVAGPVGEALIMTAAGLFVAIPAVLAYNAFTRALRVISADLDGFAHDLHTYFTMGGRSRPVNKEA